METERKPTINSANSVSFRSIDKIIVPRILESNDSSPSIFKVVKQDTAVTVEIVEKNELPEKYLRRDTIFKSKWSLEENNLISESAQQLAAVIKTESSHL